MKCGRRVSDTAGGRWRRQRRTELDRDELSVAYAQPGVTRHKLSKPSPPPGISVTKCAWTPVSVQCITMSSLVDS